MENSTQKILPIFPILIFSNTNQSKQDDINLKIICDEVKTDMHDGITELSAKKVMVRQLISQIPIHHFIEEYGKSKILNEIGLDK